MEAVLAKRNVSNPLALAVMSYLTMGPMHRYDLVRTLKANGDSRSVKFTPASVYMVVERTAKGRVHRGARDAADWRVPGTSDLCAHRRGQIRVPGVVAVPHLGPPNTSTRSSSWVCR